MIKALKKIGFFCALSFAYVPITLGQQLAWNLRKLIEINKEFYAECKKIFTSEKQPPIK